MKHLQNDLLTAPPIEFSPNQKSKPHSMPKGLARLSLTKENLNKKVFRKEDLQTCTAQCYSMSAQELKETVQVWKSSKTIKELNLGFQQCFTLNDGIFQDICRGLNGLRSLRSLSLNLMMNRNLFAKGGEYFSESLSRMRYLERLNLLLTAFNNLDARVMNCLEKGLRQLPYFNHLKLTLICNDLSEATFKLFGKLLASLLHLKSLDLVFSSCSTITSALLVSLAEELGKASNLQHLNITFESCKVVNLEKFREQICKIQSLKSFNVGIKKPFGGFGDCLNRFNSLKPLQNLNEVVFGHSSSAEAHLGQFSEETLQLRIESSSMLEELKKMFEAFVEDFPNLRNLKLNLPWGRLRLKDAKASREEEILTFSNKNFFNEISTSGNQDFLKEDLIQVKKKTTPLRKLYFEIENSHDMLDHYLADFLKEIEESAPSLEALSLKLSFCSRLTFQCFRFLIEGGYQKLKNMRELTIHSSKNGTSLKQHKKVSCDQFDTLSELLKQLDKIILETGNLQPGTKIDCLGLIANSIYFLTSLKTEKSFSTAKCILKCLHIVCRELKPLQEKISKILPSLLEKNAQISEKDLLTYIQDLNKHLKELHAFICSSQEEMALQDLAFTSLEKLNLTFEGDIICEDALPYLGEMINRNPSLQEIYLNFSNCKGFTETGFSYLAEALKSLPNLKSLSLNFFGCSKAITPCMMALESDLKNVPSLKLLKPSRKIF